MDKHLNNYLQYSKKVTSVALGLLIAVIVPTLICFLLGIVPLDYLDSVNSIINTTATFSGSVVGFYMTNSAVEKYVVNKFSSTNNDDENG